MSKKNKKKWRLGHFTMNAPKCFFLSSMETVELLGALTTERVGRTGVNKHGRFLCVATLEINLIVAARVGLVSRSNFIQLANKCTFIP